MSKPLQTNVVLKSIKRRPATTLDHLHQSKEWADLEVHLGSKVYQIHRNIVCTAIPYFKTMMSANLIETQSNSVTISYPLLDCDAFEWLLNWSYSVNQTISLANVNSLLIASDYLQVNSVFQFCCDFLDEVVAVDNVLDVKQWIGTFNVGQLRDKINTFIGQNFNSIVVTSSFVNQTVDQVVEIISDNNLNVSNEIDVFRAIVRWIKHNPTERSQCTPKLLIHLRWCQLNYEQIINQIAKEEIVSNSEDCRQIVLDVLSCLTFDSLYHKHSSTWKQPRCQQITKLGNQPVGSIVACLASSSVLELSFLDPTTNKLQSWLKINQPVTRELHKVARLGSLLILVARDSLIVNLDSGKVYQSLQELQTFDWPDLTSDINRVYVSGGVNGKSSDVVFEITAKQKDVKLLLRQLPRLTVPRAGHRLAICDGHLYVIGGRDMTNSLDSVERFDAVQDKWISMSPMNTGRSGHGVTVLNGTIYVVGGYSGLSFIGDAEYYDPKADRWMVMAPLIVKGKIVSLIAHQGKLFSFIRSPAKLVQIYDFKYNKWSVHEVEDLTDNNLIAVTQIPANFFQTSNSDS